MRAGDPDSYDTDHSFLLSFCILAGTLDFRPFRFDMVPSMKTLALILVLFASQTFAQALEDNIVYREAVENARKSGFGDLEVDNLHGEIAARVKAILEAGGLPEGPGNFEELTDGAKVRPVITGKDRAGKPYLRLRLRDGFSIASTEFPSQFVCRAHCYLYPKEGGGLEKIVFQFYRINHSGSSYVRDMRRYIHPDPRDQAQAAGKPIGAPLELLNNSKLTVEFYEAPSTVVPKWEGPDGVPDGAPDWKPLSTLELNTNVKDPIPYPKQAQIVLNYKKLLRRVDRLLARVQKMKILDRNTALEKVIDYNGSNY